MQGLFKVDGLLGFRVQVLLRGLEDRLCSRFRILLRVFRV